MRNEKPSGADLSAAFLQCADLTDAKLIGANLEGADLRGATLIDAKLKARNSQGLIFGRLTSVVWRTSPSSSLKARFGTATRGAWTRTCTDRRRARSARRRRTPPGRASGTTRHCRGRRGRQSALLDPLPPGGLLLSRRSEHAYRCRRGHAPRSGSRSPARPRPLPSPFPRMKGACAAVASRCHARSLSRDGSCPACAQARSVLSRVLRAFEPLEKPVGYLHDCSRHCGRPVPIPSPTVGRMPPGTVLGFRRSVSWQAITGEWRSGL